MRWQSLKWGSRFFWCCSPGRAYVSEDAYRAETALNDAWAALRDTVSAHYQAPEGMTLEQIAEAGRVLGLTLKRNAL